MYKALLKFAALYVASPVIFIIGKLTFLLSNLKEYPGLSLGDVFRIFGHGLSMDCAVAAYLTLLPGLIIIAMLGFGSKGVPSRLLNGYYIAVSLIVSLIVITDDLLYSFWNFKLDSTPVFYFLSSPRSALASAEWWYFLLFPVAWLALAFIFYMIYRYAMRAGGEIRPKSGRRLVGAAIVMALATALLIIPARGGLTVSTMNLSRAYFSPDPKLNHAAINPAFSLLYSLGHQNNFDQQYRYFTPEESLALFQTTLDIPADPSAPKLVNSENPDIYIIILESFSSHLFPSLGGYPVAEKLDSIAADGLMFSNIYAASFRTDRGIPAILSAYPGQPSTSIMKFASKIENLPSIASVLKRERGYEAEYYYGGDANFTNMKAYLVSAGFDKIISDTDFPIEQRLSKWGAHDHVLFEKTLGELAPYDARRPRIRVIQTSSSHEPFEVPYDDRGRFSDPRPRAFAYTDSCAAAFVNTLRASDSWQNSLVVLVPDHYGAWPELDDAVDRHRIPLIMTGGALAIRGIDKTIGSQTDIAATLLNALGIEAIEFPFSRNLLNPESPHIAFFADPSLIGHVAEDDTVVYELDSQKIISGKGTNLNQAKSYLQEIYNDLSRR